MFTPSRPASQLSIGDRIAHFFFKLMLACLFCVALLCSMPILWFINKAQTNKLTAPAPGLVIPITTHLAKGYKVVNNPTTNRRQWVPVCSMAYGGTLTVNENLMFRRNVPWATALSQPYTSSTFTYQPPQQGIPPDIVPELPWCQPGFQYAVLNRIHYRPKAV